MPFLIFESLSFRASLFANDVLSNLINDSDNSPDMFGIQSKDYEVLQGMGTG